jgi:hypothetical protein
MLGRQLQENPAPLDIKAPGVKFSNTGGLRGLCLLTCGPCMLNIDHYRRVLRMVKEFVPFLMQISNR